MSTINIDHVDAGFSDTTQASQQVFRLGLHVFARPGTLVEVPSDAVAPKGIGAAANALLLALLDQDVSLYLAPQRSAAATYYRFHTGCTLASIPSEADFVFVGIEDEMPSVETLKMGTEYAPDESATMVREVSLIEVGVGMTLTGPGIQTETRLMVPELDTAFAQTRSEIASLLPRGVDIFLTCANQLCGLPRSTRIGV
ncbi:hypothetical protein AEM42_01585 [Betaproteobacteria bacterium UKL13-2]|jgi:alpha-D-ribose 1-methylphosphonate 5-triphosphate synthase subunit PhnH|nr:hypothetical protein AEM42_01585 [Betaproteobacteria bacterium UKL13-2]HCG53529.1 phosphonate C-P lyase system protein PhnH [Betaproteobacteria bacterium]